MTFDGEMYISRFKIEAFTHREECNHCLNQNTPFCEVFAIGFDGELGCEFKERKRLSEIKESFDECSD